MLTPCCDVAQSILGGLAIPANSAGRIPLEYLNASPAFKAKAALANANQILAEFKVRDGELNFCSALIRRLY